MTAQCTMERTSIVKRALKASRIATDTVYRETGEDDKRSHPHPWRSGLHQLHQLYKYGNQPLQTRGY